MKNGLLFVLSFVLFAWFEAQPVIAADTPAAQIVSADSGSATIRLQFVPPDAPKAAPVTPPAQPAGTVSAPAAQQTAPAGATPDSPAASTVPQWLQILNNPAVLTLLISLMVGLLKWLHDNKGLDAERWEGLVIHLYNDAEQAGLLKNLKGNDKLQYALSHFDQNFQSVFGSAPTPQDRADFKIDVARVAFSDAATTPVTPPAAAAAPAAPAASAPTV